MKLVVKSWLWKLTWPFAHSNYTFVFNRLYHPKGKVPSQSLIKHESIHQKQRNEEGRIKFYLLYLFGFPLFYNPWRYKWEFEAFTEGSGHTPEYTRSILNSYRYGWLKWHS